MYAYDARDPSKRDRAVAVLDRLYADNLGALSAQVLGEFFVTVTRKLSPPLSAEEAERTVRNYVDSWPVLHVSASDVATAIAGARRHGLSYWDSLIWAVAKNHGIGHVLSEDFSSGTRLDGVRFINPLAPTFDLSSFR